MTDTPPIDTRAIAAQRHQAQQAAAAEHAQQLAAMPLPVQQAVQATQRPNVDPLEAMLTALRPAQLVVRSLPPIPVAQRHDQKLADMLARATQLHSVQVAKAEEWNLHRPGSRAFELDCLQAADEVELVELLMNAQACSWAEAFMAQRRALEADQACRDYGRTSKALHRCLEDQASQMRTEMVALLEQCIAEQKPRYRDQAAELRQEQWQPLRALQHWCEEPMQGWKPLHPSETPTDVVPVWLRTMEALGEELPPPDREGSYVIADGLVVQTGDRRV